MFGASRYPLVLVVGYQALIISSRYGWDGTHGSGRERSTSRSDTVPISCGPLGGGKLTRTGAGLTRSYGHRARDRHGHTQGHEERENHDPMLPALPQRNRWCHPQQRRSSASGRTPAHADERRCPVQFAATRGVYELGKVLYHLCPLTQFGFLSSSSKQ
jgi:hypothetical protein